ncbi:hypothetical protein BS50DRAFT_499246, partial [Corynespora cassiicola Philippines]
VPSTMARLPYSPTHLLQNASSSLLYVFRPAGGSMSSHFEFGTVDVSSTVASAHLPFTTLYAGLPFVAPTDQRPFTPVLGNGGNITVYTGDCESGAAGAEVWTFTPHLSEKSGNGTWRQQQLSHPPDAAGHQAVIGPNYLNAGMAFSPVVDGDAMDMSAYFFGGMCPFQTNTNDDSSAPEWQSSANYSNLMVTLEPAQDGTASLNYDIGVSTSRGPPIPEAGFTLTPLSASYSTRDDGTQTQQQNFVLVGGHTSSAFINMSQVALFSLPQQTWSFVPVSQPDTSRTDLAVRNDVDTVDPRSGHSAVLAPDGQSIVVFGGWVGDVDTPAEPQLAILNIGDSYGGEGEWRWTVPDASGPGLPESLGIYGHGATMLPGGVMMIMGGYSIPKPSSRPRRQQPQAANSQTLLFNITSNSWITEYSPPAQVSSNSSDDGPLSSTMQKAGLGIGLGVGVAAVISLLVFYFCYTRRLRKQREERERQLHELAMSTHRNIDPLSPGLDGRGSHGDALDYFDAQTDQHVYGQRNGWRQTQGHEAERTGLLVEIPSPTRGLRRNLSVRNGHHMTSFEERRAMGPGHHIHPIDELEEEQEDRVNDQTPLNSQQPEMSERPHRPGASIFDNAPHFDPFVDSDRSSGEKQLFEPESSSPAREKAEERHHSMTHTPTAPSKASSDRTGSNLSDRSTRSTLSSSSGAGTVSRSASIRAAAILNTAANASSSPFKTPDASPTADKAKRHSGGGWQSPTEPRTQSFTSIRSNGRADGDSFTTARTSFMQLQAEGETLLGGNPDRARPGTSSSSKGSNSHTLPNTEGTMSRADTVTAATSVADGPSATGSKVRRRSWLGSVKRALMRSSTTADRTRSLTKSVPTLETYTDVPPGSTTTSPTDHRKSFPSSSPPRRAASDASFWQSKRGMQDWLDDEMDPNDPKARWRRNSGDDWGAPEDALYMEKERRRREWRQRNSMLVDLDDSAEHTGTQKPAIQPRELGHLRADDRPATPADEEDWDVEAAVERRVVQVMFTVPKSKLRVVNADVERSSVLSLPRQNSDDGVAGEPSSSPSPRVKDLAGRFEQLGTPRQVSLQGSLRTSPRPSPSPSIASLKVRKKNSSSSVAIQSPRILSGKGKHRAVS